MEHESNIQKLDFAVLVPQAQRGDSIAVNSLLLGFTPMVRAFKYNSYLLCTLSGAGRYGGPGFDGCQ